MELFIVISNLISEGFKTSSKLGLILIVHSSLLITSMGHIKLTDFGLSKMGIMNCELNTLLAHSLLTLCSLVAHASDHQYVRGLP